MIFIKHAWRASAKINSLKSLRLIIFHFMDERIHIFFPSVFLTHRDHE
jgi:hypothetical protein